MSRFLAGLLGAAIGGILGFQIPFWYARREVRRGVDPSAAAGYSFIPIFSIPFGMVVGIVIGLAFRHGQR